MHVASSHLRRVVGFAGLWFFAMHGARAAAPAGCLRAQIAGEISAGASWQAPIGGGWVFRIAPIQPSLPEFSGWDLIVDRDRPAGYPDALLLATLPYNSINEREIGTTFGLRAQDAIGWNPRTFHFLINPASFHEAQRQYLDLTRAGELSGGSKPGAPPAAMNQLLQRLQHPASGELRIDDARLTPGTANPAPYADGWALNSLRTQHQIEPAAAGKATPRGTLHWMRFTLTLWLPAGWKLPPSLDGKPAPCP